VIVLITGGSGGRRSEEKKEKERAGKKKRKGAKKKKKVLRALCASTRRVGEALERRERHLAERTRWVQLVGDAPLGQQPSEPGHRFNRRVEGFGGDEISGCPHHVHCAELFGGEALADGLEMLGAPLGSADFRLALALVGAAGQHGAGAGERSGAHLHPRLKLADGAVIARSNRALILWAEVPVGLRESSRRE
jgi:hypothetical protein